MLKRASSLTEEAHWLEQEAQCLENEGWKKWKWWWQVQRQKVLWASEGSYSTLLHILSPTQPKKAHHIPSATDSHLPPQEPTGFIPKVSYPAAKIAEQALEVASSVASSASEEALPTDMQPLCIQLGASKKCTGARLQRWTINLMCSYLHTCAQSAPGGGVVVSLLCQTILQPRHILMPQEKSPQTVNIICK